MQLFFLPMPAVGWSHCLRHSKTSMSLMGYIDRVMRQKKIASVI